MQEIDKLELFKRYFYDSIQVGEQIGTKIWIRSNSYYIFFGEEKQFGKTYALFSKKYFLTVELTETENSKLLDEIAEIVELFRQEKGLKVEKYSYWLPHCKVDGEVIGSQLVAESYGVSKELALEYLIQYDFVFKELYKKDKKTYFGLPLFDSYEEAEEFPLKDNTKEYKKGLKHIEKIVSKHV